MMRCRLCQRESPAAEFRKKDGSMSTTCRTCRRALAQKHIKNYYRNLSKDERHRVTHARRAKAYGVEHRPYKRSEVMARWGQRCCYCDGWAAHLDHVQPLSKGGADSEENIVPACADCNLSKGAKTLAEWAETFGQEDPPF